MTWLKKIGQLIAGGLSLVAGFGPIVARVYPAAGNTIAEVTDDLSKVAGVVQSVEVIAASLGDGALSGLQKLQSAAPQVAQVVLQSELMIDHLTGKQAEIANPALFKEGCSDLATAVVKILNSRKA